MCCLPPALCLLLPLAPYLPQARWMDDNALTTLPNMDAQAAQQLAGKGLHSLPQLLHSLQQQQQQHPQGQQQRGAGQLFSREQVSSMLAAVLGGAGKAAEALAVAERLPILNLSWRSHLVGPSSSQSPAAGSGPDQNGLVESSGGGDMGRWLLEVHLQRQKPSGGRSGSSSSSGGVAPRVYAPLFPKVKEEGWWLVVGHRGSLELLAMKRVSFGGTSSVKLSLPKFTASGTELHTVTLFLCSDCYLGLDQQYDVILDESAAAGEARASAAAAARASWVGSNSSSGNNGPAAAATAAAGDGGGGGSEAAMARRARRQQQMAARQQHEAGGDDSWGQREQADGQIWEDEPACG